MSTTQDFSPAGTKIEGAWENDRNHENSDLYKSIIREAFGVQDVICGHHLIYEWREKRVDGFVYDMVQEIPSADTLIFDHAVAKKIWGAEWQSILTRLALEPPETRDQLLSKLYYEGHYTKKEAA